MQEGGLVFADMKSYMNHFISFIIASQGILSFRNIFKNCSTTVIFFRSNFALKPNPFTVLKQIDTWKLYENCISLHEKGQPSALMSSSGCKFVLKTDYNFAKNFCLEKCCVPKYHRLSLIWYQQYQTGYFQHS